MGTVYAEITLKNSFDVSIAREGRIPKEKVRETTVRALVNTGARTLVINEELRQKLGLEIRGQRKSIWADGGRQIYQVTEPVDIHWKDREISCRALVVPQATEALLGAIPLEDLDLIEDPTEQTLKGAHGDEVLTLIM